MRRLSWQSFVQLARTEMQHLIAVQQTDRRWQMPVAAALASGLPLLVGAYFGHLEYGLVSSLGGLIFLYLPNSPLQHRMVLLMACAFGMAACYTLGILSHFVPPLMVPILVFTSILVTMVSRFYGLGPPGSLFFIMTASIGAYSPIQILDLPLRVGLLTLGCLLACLIAFFYSLYILRLEEPGPVPPLPPATFEFVVFDSVIIGVFVGISLLLAQLLQLERPYWVPVSCLAVIQGASLRAVWNKQLQRVLGTTVGLLVAWALLLQPLNEWTIPLAMMALTFIVEMTVVRHYGFAVIFITPLTILLAEAATLGQHMVPAELVHSRFYDTLLGCAVGLAGGICLHSPAFRRVVGGWMRRLMPQPAAR